VKEARHAHRLFDHGSGRRPITRDLQRWVKVLGPLAGQMHRTEGVLEA
jgi:hypothetical protein